MSDDSKPQRVVAKKQLIALIRDADQKKDKMQSISGELGERVKTAVENGHLHKGVFALCVKLYRMEEDKRNDFLRQMPLYLDMCREEGLFGSEHVGDLVDEAQRADDEPDRDEDAEAAERNAAALKAGIKPLDAQEAEFDDATSAKPSRRTRPVGDAPASTRIQ